MGEPRGRRRWLGAAGAVAAVAVAVVVVVGGDRPPDVEPVPSNTVIVEEDDASDGVPFGGVSDVSVSVAPRTGLDDGDDVRIAVDGLAHLPDDTIALMCRGDVRAEGNPAAACDQAAVHAVDGGPEGAIGPLVTEQMHVRLGRVLTLASGPHDCAVEPAGCILVLAPYTLPARGIAVPLAFRDRPLPEATATIEQPSAALDGDDVVVTGTGFRPHSEVWIVQCAGDRCDRALGTITTRVSGQGLVETLVEARSTIYPYDGRVDCVAAPCRFAVESASGDRRATTEPISFAAEVVAPEPRLTLDPPGPYVEGQVVTVTGAGFPPGLDIGRGLGQCPADRDTAHEERCTYGSVSSGAVVAPDGTFALERRLTASLPFTGACWDTGCVLGWVIDHGTTVAAVPIEMTP